MKSNYAVTGILFYIYFLCRSIRIKNNIYPVAWFVITMAKNIIISDNFRL